MTQPFGAGKEYFKYSLFLVLCNRVLTVTLALGLLLARLILHVSAAPRLRSIRAQRPHMHLKRFCLCSTFWCCTQHQNVPKDTVLRNAFDC